MCLKKHLACLGEHRAYAVEDRVHEKKHHVYAAGDRARPIGDLSHEKEDRVHPIANLVHEKKDRAREKKHRGVMPAFPCNLPRVMSENLGFTSVALQADALGELLEAGFVVLPGLIAQERVTQLAKAYDVAVANASPADLRIGSTTTRVHDFVNRGPEFDELYVCPPVLEACRRVMGTPFKLSSFLARTVRPRTGPQPLHVDLLAEGEEWPLVGFIVMVDDFTAGNGATRFVPGSHRWHAAPDHAAELRADAVLACGPAGSVIVYSGSVWHDHSANRTGEPRRSLQGAYVGRDAASATDWTACIRPDTLRRISPLAKSVLGV